MVGHKHGDGSFASEALDPSLCFCKRLFLLMEILQKYTEENHQITIQEIVEKFVVDYGFEVKPSWIKNDLTDLKTLNFFPVNSNQESNGLSIYYSSHRPFELHELRLMIDAISSAKFITKDDTEKIINRLRRLTSNYQADAL